MLDGGSHYYGTCECADGPYVSIGSIEPQFYALLMELAELPERTSATRTTPRAGREMKAQAGGGIQRKTQAQW